MNSKKGKSHKTIYANMTLNKNNPEFQGNCGVTVNVISEVCIEYQVTTGDIEQDPSHN